MIIGAHAMIFSKDASADRAFLARVLKLSKVDAGGGFLIFGLPPAELAIHEGDANDHHQLFLMCDKIDKFIAKLAKEGIACSEVQVQTWGLSTGVTLPGGGTLGVYEPRHKRPKPKGLAAPAAKPKKTAVKKVVAKKKAVTKKKPAKAAKKKRK